MYEELEKTNHRPKPFEFYTAKELWTDEHTSKQMLKFHLNEAVDVSSRNIKFINRSAEWIKSFFHIEKNTIIADFGCGPGLYTIRFAQMGARVTGIDFSKNSIEYARESARKNHLDIDYINENYLSFHTDKKFDLITMIMCDYCALSPEQREKILSQFYRLLKPDGSVLLDVYTINAFKKRSEQTVFEPNLLNGFWAPGKYYGFLNTFKYDDEKVILDKYTIFEKHRDRTVYNWLQYFSRETITAEIENSGFIVSDVFADVAGSEYDPGGDEMAVVARKT
ncbi:methyltransferase domain-containing protein [candidate division KSB1 bacterium]|nr:methyltransferase domain-containing protein [candidate division KSB1 bacterium]